MNYSYFLELIGDFDLGPDETEFGNYTWNEVPARITMTYSYGGGTEFTGEVGYYSMVDSKTGLNRKDEIYLNFVGSTELDLIINSKNDYSQLIEIFNDRDISDIKIFTDEYIATYQLIDGVVTLEIERGEKGKIGSDSSVETSSVPVGTDQNDLRNGSYSILLDVYRGAMIYNSSQVPGVKIFEKDQVVQVIREEKIIYVISDDHTIVWTSAIILKRLD